MKKFLLITVFALAGSWLQAQISVSFSGVTASCNNSGTATATASGGTAPYTYQWYYYTDLTTVVATGPNLTGATGGYYLVVATDANSVNSGQQYYTYIANTLQAYVSNTVDATCPMNNGSATYTVANGLAPFDYTWSNGQTFTNQSSNSSTISNLAPGQYTVSITDANGCTFNQADSAAYVYSIASFSATMSSTPANCNDGTATATVTGAGTPPYSYYWNLTPPQTTATATGLNGGNYYYVTITDANGCSIQRWAQVTYGPNALQVSGTTTSAICPNSNGAVNINVSSGNPPYTYAWSNGATTQDLSGVASGTYTLNVVDNAGCYITITKYVGQSSPVNTSVSTTQTNCANNSGTASVNATGGTGPYTYLWDDGQTTSTATGLSAGYHGVLVTDANGCHNNYGAYGLVTIPAACMSGVSGFVYNDMDGNCSLNGAETGFPWQIISLGNGYYASTNQNGAFLYTSLTAGTYTVSHNPSDPNWSLLCPTAAYTVTTTPGSVQSGNVFYDVPASLQNDVSIYVSNGVARPGFTHYKYYSVYNAGTTTMSGTVEIVHDVNEVFLGGPGVTAYNPTTRTITIAYNNLPANGYEYNHLSFSLPVSVTIGTILNTSAQVNPVSGDLTPANNVASTQTTVVGSYDPNMKEVSPAGLGASGLIDAANDHFDYTIHFQNTGTYAAETVVIIDTLDQDLDIPTFQLLGQSHNVTWEISGPRVVKFTFNSINLPDSNSNEPASHGFVSYRIKQLPNLTGGTEIRNTAYIYFDYNAPIVTNTTLNTIQIVGVKENVFNSGISISPNPAQDKITITNKSNESCKKVEIMDINGRTIASIIPTTNGSVQLPEMAAGVYIVNAHFASGIYKEKLVIGK